MSHLYEHYPLVLKFDYPKMKQRHIKLSVKKTVLYMQTMSDKVIKQSIKDKEDELSEDQWESGDDDNSHGSESD